MPAPEGCTPGESAQLDGQVHGRSLAGPLLLQAAMATLGFHCSHEQHSPSALLAHAKRAAEAGFTAGMCSDHFHPWSESQGHSGFAWSWLGAALEATPMSFGTVCAPGQRYHPAVIAQAAATLASMYPGRFWLALGSGEALNETITGDEWPDKRTRNARLRECVDVMRALWAGDTVTVRGLTRTEHAKLYSRPAQLPMIVGAALTPETAGWLAQWADAMITVAGPRDSMRAVVDAFRDAGGAAKPVLLQVALSYAATQEEAERAAHSQWRQCGLASELLANLSTPAAFDRATAAVSMGDVVSRMRVSSDPERHLGWLQEDAGMGFERIYLHNVAREHQDRFIDLCGSLFLPSFGEVTA